MTMPSVEAMSMQSVEAMSMQSAEARRRGIGRGAEARLELATSGVSGQRTPPPQSHNSPIWHPLTEEVSALARGAPDSCARKRAPCVDAAAWRCF